MTERRYQIFGDWRDLRGAINAHDPNWIEHTEEERKKLWDFAQGVLKNYMPLKAQCTTCRKIVSWGFAYRCSDCHAVCCESCIIPHFGPNHRPHDSR